MKKFIIFWDDAPEGSILVENEVSSNTIGDGCDDIIEKCNSMELYQSAYDMGFAGWFSIVRVG